MAIAKTVKHSGLKRGSMPHFLNFFGDYPLQCKGFQVSKLQTILFAHDALHVLRKKKLLIQLCSSKIMEQISIENVLVKLNDTVDNATLTVKAYGIRFITAEGEKREILCRKKTKDAKTEIQGLDPKGKQYYHLQANGVLLLDDLIAGHPKSIKAAMIYGFQDYQSPKWLNVFH
jgi:hypothetical protein